MRTHVYIVTLQLAYGLVLLLVFWFVLEHTYREMLFALVNSVSQLFGYTPFEATGTVREIFLELNPHEHFLTLLLLFLFTMAAGVVMGYYILKPSRSALVHQKRFIGNIAHEIRTPLSILKTDTEVTLMSKDLDDEISTLLHENIKEIDHISNIINNLISFNKLFYVERMKFQNVSLSAVSKKVITVLEPLAKQRKVSVQLKTNGDDYVWGNETALEQLVLNVVKNAITYSHEGQNAVVSVFVRMDDDKSVHLIVSDKGIGMKQTELTHILEPFYRAQQSSENAQGTSGLGLTLVHEIAKTHNANIIIRSKKGVGTTVRVIFRPVRRRGDALATSS